MEKKEHSEIKKAVAIKYNQEEDNAPVVVATGEGWLAEKIIEIAKEKDVKIFEDKYLVESLRLLNIDEEIPVELYEALASILAFVFRVDQRYDKKEK